MSKKQIWSLVFLSILTISCILLFILINKGFNMFNSDTITISDFNITFYKMQKTISLVSISSFIILLIFSLIYYYIYNRITYIVISNIVYIFSTLINYVNLSKSYNDFAYKLTQQASNEHLFNILIGTFFIVGAILVSFIGYYAIRNLNKLKNK